MLGFAKRMLPENGMAERLKKIRTACGGQRVKV
jgi:hypothetical protein